MAGRHSLCSTSDGHRHIDECETRTCPDAVDRIRFGLCPPVPLRIRFVKEERQYMDVDALFRQSHGNHHGDEEDGRRIRLDPAPERFKRRDIGATSRIRSPEMLLRISPGEIERTDRRRGRTFFRPFLFCSSIVSPVSPSHDLTPHDLTISASHHLRISFSLSPSHSSLSHLTFPLPFSSDC